MSEMRHPSFSVAIAINGQNALFKIAAKLVFRTNARQTMLTTLTLTFDG